MEERKLTCIGCPMGCQLQVIIKDGIVEKVTGNTCKRGADYLYGERRRDFQLSEPASSE